MVTIPTAQVDALVDSVVDSAVMTLMDLVDVLADSLELVTIPMAQALAVAALVV